MIIRLRKIHVLTILRRSFQDIGRMLQPFEQSSMIYTHLGFFLLLGQRHSQPFSNKYYLIKV